MKKIFRVRRTASIALCAALLLPIWAKAVSAQDVADPGQEAMRAEEMERRREALAGFRPGGALAAELGPAPIEGGPCFAIAHITVDGAYTLKPDEIAAQVSPYLGKCLRGADVQRLMEGFDVLYAERGYITSRTYLPQQNLRAGTLRLEVLEGRVSSVIALDETATALTNPRARRQLTSAFPGVVNKIFYLRDFEQGLDQINRLKSVDAVMRLQPGANPGFSDVLIVRKSEDVLRGTVTLNNKGARSTGRNRMETEIEADDLFGLNDTWSLSYDGTQNTNAIGINGSIPWGYWTFGMSANYSEYLLPLTDTAELFGRSEVKEMSFTRMLRRDQHSTTEILLNFGTNRSERFVNAAPLTPQWLTTTRIGVRHIRQSDRGRWSFDGGLTFGLDSLSATKDVFDVTRTEPHAQFVKFDGGLFRAANLGKSGAEWGALQTDLRLQFAPVALYPSEQLSIGSETTVRGYEASEAWGDSGFYLRNDLLMDPGLLFKSRGHGETPGWAENLQLSGFFDFGIVYDHGTDSWGQAAGLGIGLGYSKKNVAAKATVALPLIQNNVVKVGVPLVQLNVTVKSF